MCLFISPYKGYMHAQYQDIYVCLVLWGRVFFAWKCIKMIFFFSFFFFNISISKPLENTKKNIDLISFQAKRTFEM